ncbi:hypothetical protein PCAR4_1210023 [Paraburkholderia caribensis]|nr:hypothetical protein PCAR4_1210023 [Paraburkholderia caribensis]
MQISLLGGWLCRASRVLATEEPLTPFPYLKRWFDLVNARPAAERAHAVGRDHVFKRETDEQTRRALFPSNYPDITM